MFNNIGLPGLLVVLGVGPNPDLWIALSVVPLVTLLVPPFHGLSAVAVL